MDINNYEKRNEIQGRLKKICQSIDEIAQSSMIKEIVLMFAGNNQFKECEQIINFFRAKIDNEDYDEIKNYLFSTYNYELKGNS